HLARHRHRQGLRHPRRIGTVPDRARRRPRRHDGRPGQRVRDQYRSPPARRLVRRRDVAPCRAPQLTVGDRADQARRPRRLRDAQGMRRLRGRRRAVRARPVPPVGAAPDPSRLRGAAGLADRPVPGHGAVAAAQGGAGLRRFPVDPGRGAGQPGGRGTRQGAVRALRRMRVCVVGAGGREHALAHVLARTADVVVTPGNPGTATSERTISTPAPPEEIEADLYVIGPEAPLVDGLADRLRADGRLVLGPGADGARLEGSKAWMKEVLGDAGVPTAAHRAFTAVEPALQHLATASPPYVVKTDGLAAGKGVLVTGSLAEAAADVEAKLSGRAFGPAGHRVVIEEGLTGEELSLLALCDGRRVLPLAPAQDFKRVGDGDVGPNTGGMGAYSPVPTAGPDVVDAVVERAVEPLLAALRRRGIDYRGVLYAGLMLTAEGPKLLEFNVRFGDPETQVVLPRLATDLAGLLEQAAAGDLYDTPAFVDDACVTVVLASEGYPASPRTGPASGTRAAGRGRKAAGGLRPRPGGGGRGAPRPAGGGRGGAGGGGPQRGRRRHRRSGAARPPAGRRARPTWEEHTPASTVA